jgi:pyruvate kinase
LEETTDELINNAEEAILKNKLLAIGDTVLFCAGKTPILGATNMIKFLNIGEAVRSAIGILNA